MVDDMEGLFSHASDAYRAGTRRPAMPLTAADIAEAWHSVTDEWIVRLNKMHDFEQWEVVHDWGVDVIAPETRKLVARFHTQEEAEECAERLEDQARATAVLRLIETTK